MQAMTARNIISGFRSTGIFPFNKNLFTDSEFASAMVTDRPMNDIRNPPISPPSANLIQALKHNKYKAHSQVNR
jgi:hypothetical protein